MKGSCLRISDTEATRRRRSLCTDVSRKPRTWLRSRSCKRTPVIVGRATWSSSSPSYICPLPMLPCSQAGKSPCNLRPINNRPEGNVQGANGEEGGGKLLLAADTAADRSENIYHLLPTKVVGWQPCHGLGKILSDSPLFPRMGLCNVQQWAEMCPIEQVGRHSFGVRDTCQDSVHGTKILSLNLITGSDCIKFSLEQVFFVFFRGRDK